MIHEWTSIICPPSQQTLLSLSDTRLFIQHVWRTRRLQIDFPEIKDGYQPRTDGKIIELPYWGRSLPIILHEVAHVICASKEEEIHGQKFMETLIDLYADYLYIQREYMIEQAKDMKLWTQK